MPEPTTGRDLDPSRPEPEDNPYAPPGAELAGPRPQAPPIPYAGEPFSPERVLSRAWELYKANFVLAFWLFNLPFLISLVYNVVGAAMSQSVDQDTTMGQVAGVMFRLSGAVLGVWLQSGTTLAMIRLARGLPTRVGDIYQGGPYVLRMIGATLLFSLLLVAIGAACLVPAWLFYRADNPLGVLIAFLVGGAVWLVLMLLCAARLNQFYYLIIDQDDGVLASLRRSVTLTRGHTAEVLVLLLVGVAVYFSGALLCGVGIFFTAPWTMLLLACIYVSLVAERHHEFAFEVDDGEVFDDRS